MHGTHFHLKLTERASVNVVARFHSFLVSLLTGHQMSQKNSRMLMTLVIIINDLHRSKNNWPEKVRGDSALVVFSVCLSVLRSQSQSNSIKQYHG